MDFRLFDTAKGEVVPIKPREPGKISIYVCGPTVYDLPHIGHGRMVLTYDVLRRYLESRGVEVHHVSNITDIEDKIINRSKETGESTETITARYEAEWWSALEKMNVLRPTQDPHATAYVKQMVELIGRLIESGHAYETSDSVYFSSEKVSDYGLLARQSVGSLRAGARVGTDNAKRSPIDFALWKKVDAPNEPVWDSPWGSGRPGWHTECVVMSLDLLGDGFDIHSGGLDLAFPHHENERAQAVALGHRFASHWMHNGFVEMGGEKMSKSVGNFTTLTDMLNKTDPRAYRLLVLRAHYRSPIEVTAETVADAEAAMSRLDDFARRFRAEATESKADLNEFNRHMDNDLDTPRGVAEIFALVREANTDADGGRDDEAQKKANAVFAMCSALGLHLPTAAVEIDADTAELVRRRDDARATKDWVSADNLRDEFKSRGWVVDDTSEGTKLHR